MKACLSPVVHKVSARARELQRSSTFYKMEAEHAAASEERHALKQLAEQQAAALAASESEARGRNRKQAVLAQELAAERRLRLDAEAAVHEQDVRLGALANELQLVHSGLQASAAERRALQQRIGARDAAVGASTKAARRLHKAVLDSAAAVTSNAARARNWAKLADVQAEVRERYEELHAVAEAKLGALAEEVTRAREAEAAAREDAVHASVLLLQASDSRNSAQFFGAILRRNSAQFGAQFPDAAPPPAAPADARGARHADRGGTAARAREGALSRHAEEAAMPRAAMVISEMALALPPLVGPSSAEAELARSVAEGKAPATEVTLAAAEAAPAAMAAALRDLDAEGTFLSHMVGALAGHTLVDEAGAAAMMQCDALRASGASALLSAAAAAAGGAGGGGPWSSAHEKARRAHAREEQMVKDAEEKKQNEIDLWKAKAARSQADIRADALEEEGERLREQLAAAAARHDALAERASRERAEGAAATAAARAEAAAAREEVARARDELLGAREGQAEVGGAAAKAKAEASELRATVAAGRAAAEAEAARAEQRRKEHLEMIKRAAEESKRREEEGRAEAKRQFERAARAEADVARLKAQLEAAQAQLDIAVNAPLALAAAEAAAAPARPRPTAMPPSRVVSGLNLPGALLEAQAAETSGAPPRPQGPAAMPPSRNVSTLDMPAALLEAQAAEELELSADLGSTIGSQDPRRSPSPRHTRSTSDGSDVASAFAKGGSVVSEPAPPSPPPPPSRMRATPPKSPLSSAVAASPTKLPLAASRPAPSAPALPALKLGALSASAAGDTQLPMPAFLRKTGAEIPAAPAVAPAAAPVSPAKAAAAETAAAAVRKAAARSPSDWRSPAMEAEIAKQAAKTEMERVQEMEKLHLLEKRAAAAVAENSVLLSARATDVLLAKEAEATAEPPSPEPPPSVSGASSMSLLSPRERSGEAAAEEAAAEAAAMARWEAQQEVSLEEEKARLLRRSASSEARLKIRNEAAESSRARLEMRQDARAQAAAAIAEREAAEEREAVAAAAAARLAEMAPAAAAPVLPALSRLREAAEDLQSSRSEGELREVALDDLDLEEVEAPRGPPPAAHKRVGGRAGALLADEPAAPEEDRFMKKARELREARETQRKANLAAAGAASSAPEEAADELDEVLSFGSSADDL